MDIHNFGEISNQISNFEHLQYPLSKICSVCWKTATSCRTPTF